ncbi:serine/threonine-protein kinase RIO1-like [Tropilaelaps mercedesae]|uniref:Serine/threonine-protein kinase RIO1 n=1 Tax=Tropilaelaps mercedesae TaxID=418985 RepID=A0A1V9XZI6_9ACAR|nr:serine/threonine-protein kinase RIO1-like [Tropilaelaps mercedesae]
MAAKYSSKVSLDAMWVAERALNVVTEQQRRAEHDRIRVKDKMERATVEQVLDARTRMILFKMLARGVFEEINGCISTGKEANVYYASKADEQQFAVKVYKTSILVFKDRDRYVTGEFRFRGGYCSGNPRKMVRLWAEKEMRNLTRLEKVGIPCPKPHLLRSHVLVMEFVGKGGWPAPKLKDVPLTETKARKLYLSLIIDVRRLFHECRLVHADLSEYNLLYHEGRLVFIDVSQSVEHEHPNALLFLRKDLTNVTDFFSRCGVATMTLRELFDFVVSPVIEDVDGYLENMAEICAIRGVLDSKQIVVDEEVFKNSYIPRRLDQVIDYERDVKKFQKGEDLLYKTVTGLDSVEEHTAKGRSVLSNGEALRTGQADGLVGEEPSDGVLEAQLTRVDNQKDENDDSSFVSDESNDDGEEESDCDKPTGGARVSVGRPKDETTEAKRERKKAVKEAARERRKEKTPKHVKKRREKMGRSKKK